MDNIDKIEAYFALNRPFKEEISVLRELVLKTALKEEYKWGVPVYTLEGKNVLGILAFKHHFALWFYNGVFLKDSEKVLENAQKGKTKAMRHWKFRAMNEIDHKNIPVYIAEAIANQKKGIELKPQRKKAMDIPPLLRNALQQKQGLEKAFGTLSPYKQREYCEYITMAKQEKTKTSRLQKILPFIEKGIGLHDAYRN
ncbi:YdeI/OmpD-associated family protein [Spongiimicrobium sp. 3-5]|uniref:YdeI/OmpD-associated family protein n=1 Tax=Spongiimicrobium sp. 3-5 TaxID=3332596 RepID=UPI003980379D